MNGKIYDKYHQHTGYIERYGSGYKTYDEYHNHTGYIEPYESGYKTYDEYHGHTGYIEPYGSDYKTYDEYHKHTGYIEQYGSDFKLYDEYHNHIGYVETNDLGSSAGYTPSDYIARDSAYSATDYSSYKKSSSGGGDGGCFANVLGAFFWVLVLSFILTRCDLGTSTGSQSIYDANSNSSGVNLDSEDNSYEKPKIISADEFFALEHSRDEEITDIFAGGINEGIAWDYLNGQLVIAYPHYINDEGQMIVDFPPKGERKELPYCNMYGYPWDSYEYYDYLVNLSESVREVYVDNGFENIYSGTFFGCSNLTDLYLGMHVESISENAFNWDSIENIYFAGSEMDWYRINIYNLEGYPIPNFFEDLQHIDIHYNSDFELPSTWFRDSVG